MKTITFKIIESTVQLACWLTRREVHMEPYSGFFCDCERSETGGGEWQFWGLGLWVVVSPRKRRRLYSMRDEVMGEGVFAKT